MWKWKEGRGKSKRGWLTTGVSVNQAGDIITKRKIKWVLIGTKES